MFERNADNYSLRDQLALHKATVAVCGLGGGGGYVAEILARTGVGKFILIDGDCFEDSNRNRQIGALGSTLGRLKVEVMAERLRDVSPWVSVSAHPAFIGPETADLLSGADVVCDCVDGDNKRVLNALCRDRGVPYCTAFRSPCSANRNAAWACTRFRAWPRHRRIPQPSWLVRAFRRRPSSTFCWAATGAR